MPTSVRLDPQTEALLRRLARRSGRSKSEVIREALHRMAAERDEAAEPETLYRSIEDLIGITDEGPEDLAERHKERFRAKLHGRRG
jgi:Arc/MetJ-type ribon-helix-helix transcriptional regulator